MAFLFYFLIFPLIFFFSRLPFWWLYRLSDLFYLIVYKLIGYRKKVVRKNLKLAFPDKTAAERKQIEKAFYKHFTDLFVEMIKAFNLSLPAMRRHFEYVNPELLNALTEQGKNIVMVGSHYGNWEGLIALAPSVKALPIATYLKINNPYFEKFMLKNRQRFGAKLVETKQLRKTLTQLDQADKKFIVALVSDQSPQMHKAKYWRSFLGVPDLPVFTGAEELAKKFDAAVVFFDIQKKKRGNYQVKFELITDTPHQFPDYKLTDRFIDLAEKQIKKQPAYYLWTHNRFKHSGKKKGGVISKK